MFWKKDYTIHYLPDIPTIVEPYIIEGIGSLTGLISPLNGLGTAYELICFSDSNVTIFPDASTSCVLINTLYYPDLQDAMQIKINSNILFVLSKSTGKVKSLKILDLNSKLLEYCSEPQINVSGLHGVYILEVVLSDNNSYRYKIVIL